MLAMAFPGPFEILILLVFMTLLFGSLALWIYALVDVIRRDFRDPNMKIVWLLIIVFTHAIGAIIYLIVGRNQGTLNG